ncbi:MAG: hypothetical protein IKN57_11925, partial [Parasporobacterium sp.]|nr:hypothetical protein [Parasporobacterium sp.]
MRKWCTMLLSLALTCAMAFSAAAAAAEQTNEAITENGAEADGETVISPEESGTDPAADSQKTAAHENITEADAEAAEETGEVIPFPSADSAGTESIPYWCADSPAMASIVSFVEAVSDETSPDYIPAEKRIAVFDSDGTLCG